MATKTVSVVTGGTNSATVTAEEINAQRTDFFSTGIINAISLNTGSGGTGGFAVNAQSSPNMSVRVSSGSAVVSGTPSGGNSQNVKVVMTSFEDVTIAANSTGSTKYDWVYISLDTLKLANPAVNKDDIATLVTSRSSSNSVDNGTPPTYGYCLGIVTVANAAASITNSNITDSRVRSGASSIAAGAVVPAATLSNPYKFRVARAAAQNTGAGVFGLVTFDTKQFDTGSNYSTSTGLFTAPVAGFYQFNWFTSVLTSGTQTVITSLYKNGAEYSRGGRVDQASTFTSTGGADLIQLAAGDTIAVYVLCTTARPIDAGITNNFFSGFLVSTL